MFDKGIYWCSSTITNNKLREDNSVESLIDSIRALYKTNKSYVPISRIAKAFGFKIYPQDLNASVYGYIALDTGLNTHGDEDRAIYINQHMGEYEQRFEVAYLLGIYFYDYDPDRNMSYYHVHTIENSDGSSEEKKANLFAKRLMIPKGQLELLYNEFKYKKGNVLANLAAYFKVPVSMIESELKDRGINYIRY